jgi:hypothetical protein
MIEKDNSKFVKKIVDPSTIELVIACQIMPGSSDLNSVEEIIDASLHSSNLLRASLSSPVSKQNKNFIFIKENVNLFSDCFEDLGVFNMCFK